MHHSPATTRRLAGYPIGLLAALLVVMFVLAGCSSDASRSSGRALPGIVIPDERGYSQTGLRSQGEYAK